MLIKYCRGHLFIKEVYLLAQASIPNFTSLTCIVLLFLEDSLKISFVPFPHSQN